MAEQSKRRGTLMQRIWWKIRELYQQLKPCRFSIGVAVVGFLCLRA
jgi:hypothetical protein